MKLITTMYETIHVIANEHPKMPAEVIRMGKYKLFQNFNLTALNN